MGDKGNTKNDISYCGRANSAVASVQTVLLRVCKQYCCGCTNSAVACVPSLFAQGEHRHLGPRPQAEGQAYVADADVEKCLKLLTFLPLDEISKLVNVEGAEINKAKEVLDAAGVSSSIADVFAVTLENYPGTAADAISFLSRAGIGISYLYSFMLSGKGILIFRTDDPAGTADVIRRQGMSVLDDDSLLSLV